jgi:MFS family permease
MLREALLAAGILNVVMLVCAAALFSVPVMAPEIAADLGVQPTLVGGYSGVLWSASLVSSFASGRLIARFGAMGVSQLSVAICAVGLLAGALGTLPTFLIASIVIGLAHGLETPASSQLLARLAPPRDQPLVFSSNKPACRSAAY